MKKALVLNRVETMLPEENLGCIALFKRFFKGVDEFKETSSEKILLEKLLSERFAKVSAEGFKYENGLVKKHLARTDEITYQDFDYHGIYTFKHSSLNADYKAYFGPLVDISPKATGCKIGCKPLQGIGCGKSKGIGCSKPKSIGCKSAGGDGEQHVNFFNNDKNIEVVQKLNKYFGFRLIYNKETQDILLDHVDAKKDKVFPDAITENREAILNVLKADLEALRSEGYGFESLVETPSLNSLYSNAILFSKESTKQIDEDSLADPKSDLASASVYLSAFDLFYFKEAEGLLKKILRLLLKIITLGYFPRKKEDDIYVNPQIEDKNIDLLENIYTAELNEQEAEQERINQIRDERKLQDAIDRVKYIGKIPVTLACLKKQGLFIGKKYEFVTYMIDVFAK